MLCNHCPVHEAPGPRYQKLCTEVFTGHSTQTVVNTEYVMNIGVSLQNSTKFVQISPQFLRKARKKSSEIMNGKVQQIREKGWGQQREWVEFSDLLRCACCSQFDLVVGGGCSGDLHDWGRGLRVRNRSTGLWCYRGGLHLPNQPHAASDADVGVSFHSHVKNLQAIVIETWHLALEGAAVVSFPAPDLDGHLAVEDCELTACGRTKLLQYKKTYCRLKRNIREGEWWK